MTTIVKQIRIARQQRVATKHSKAFLPLEAVLKALEEGKSFENNLPGVLDHAINTFGVYAQYQAKELAAGEDMDLDNFKSSIERAAGIVVGYGKLKQEDLTPRIKIMDECLASLNDTLKGLEIREKKHVPAPTVKKHLISVAKVNGKIVVNGIVQFDTHELAMEFIRGVW